MFRLTDGIDLYAAALSLLCLFHCLALPLMTSLFPLFGQLTGNEQVHQALVLLAAPATLWTVLKSRPIAADQWLFIMVALGGLALLMLAGFVEALEPHELWLTVIGSLCLASAHLRRWSQHTLPKTPDSDPSSRHELSHGTLGVKR